MNGRYEKNIASLAEANKVLLSSREELQSLLESNLGKLHETETRLERENASLSEELRVARRTAAIESEQRRIEFSQQQAALQREQVDRSRLETSNVRLRHAAINANRNGYWVRQNLEHQSRQAVEDLKRLLHLDKAPRRIEGFDISNTMGNQSVASMVVWEDGQMKKADYRRFKIQTVIGANDFASMQEVVARRYGDSEHLARPDLILIDASEEAAAPSQDDLRLHGSSRNAV